VHVPHVEVAHAQKLLNKQRTVRAFF
jgi:hypothetical protein